VATSSVEAEYVADGHTTKQALWLRSILSELGFPQDTILIKSDNQGAIALTEDPTFHARTKHIDIQHHFIRERVAAGHVKLIYEPMETLIADIMTKALSRNQHHFFTEHLGLAQLEGES